MRNLADACFELQIRAYQLRAEELRVIAEHSKVSHCRDDLLNWAALYENWIVFMEALRRETDT